MDASLALGSQCAVGGSPVYQRCQIRSNLKSKSHHITSNPLVKPEARFTVSGNRIHSNSVIRRRQYQIKMMVAPSKDPAPKGPASKDPALKDPASKDPASKDSVPKGPASKDPAPKGPASKDPPAKGPVSKDPTPKDPASKDPASKDPAPKDPAPKDPAPKDPAPKDPASKDPASKDPAPKDPASKDPTPKDPTTKGPAVYTQVNLFNSTDQYLTLKESHDWIGFGNPPLVIRSNVVLAFEHNADPQVGGSVGGVAYVAANCKWIIAWTNMNNQRNKFYTNIIKIDEPIDWNNIRAKLISGQAEVSNITDYKTTVTIDETSPTPNVAATLQRVYK